MTPTGNLDLLAVTVTDMHTTLQSMLRCTGTLQSRTDRAVHQSDPNSLRQLRNDGAKLREDAAGLLDAATEGEKIATTLVDATKA